jgi:hypothetical protein
MSEPHLLRNMPAHLALVRELSRLDFEFDQRPEHPYRIRGFAPDSVVEIAEGPPLHVTLLFSASTSQRSLIRSTMSLVALASVLGVDFTDWLAAEIRRNQAGGSDEGWRTSRRFGRCRVHAEHLSSDAILLTVEAASARLA